MTATLHAQLRESLMEQIVTGALPKGTQIPSERELCRSHGVSRTTTRRTVSELVHEGWLYTVVGKGTYVARNRLEQELRPFTGFTDDLRTRGIDVRSQVIAAEYVKAPESIAYQLGLLPRAPLFRLHRLRLAADTPIAVQQAWLPEHLCPGLIEFDFAVRSLYEVLQTEFGLRIKEGRTVIKAGAATAAEATLLKLDASAAVLRTDQSTFLDDGRPIEFCQSVFHGELYELTVRQAT